MTPQQQATIDAMVEEIKKRATATDDPVFRAEMELYAELLPAFLRWQLPKSDDDSIDGEQFFRAAICGLADIGAHLLRNMSGGDAETLNEIGPAASIEFSRHMQIQTLHAIPGMTMPKKDDKPHG